MGRDMSYISRLGVGVGGSWIVRIHQGRPDEIYKTFPDSSHDNNSERALAAAIEYRDQMRGPKRSVNRTSSNNRSGFIGVWRYEKKKKNYAGWRASYSEEGKQRDRVFAVNTFGECEAFRRACRLRYEKTGELRQIAPDPLIPCPPDVPITKGY